MIHQDNLNLKCFNSSYIVINVTIFISKENTNAAHKLTGYNFREP